LNRSFLYAARNAFRQFGQLSSFAITRLPQLGQIIVAAEGSGRERSVKRRTVESKCNSTFQFSFVS
jgi:hypothetical protein